MLTTPVAGTTLKFSTREVEGSIFPSREEIRAEVTGGDGFAEVTFALARASRPGQFEWLGTDDAAPYRIFWRPPPDLAPDDELTFLATVSDLRGHRASAQVEHIKVAPGDIAFGIRGSTVPTIVLGPPPLVQLAADHDHALVVQAAGTGPLEYQWLRDDEEIPGAGEPSLIVSQPGRYAVLVRNRAGTTVSPETTVSIVP